jgi:hypothetical protein
MAAGLFWALWLPIIWLPTVFWETSFSCCILIGSIAFAGWLERRGSNWRFLTAGACIAVAGLINPALLPALLSLLLWVAYKRRRTEPLGAIFALATLTVVFLPWPVRNALVFHAFIPLRSTVGFEMWMGNRPHSTGFLDESLFPTFNATELGNYVRMGEVAYVAQKSAEAWEYVGAHPFVFIQLSLRRVFRFWTGTGTLGGSPFYMLQGYATSLLGLLGLALLIRRRSDMAPLMLLPLLIFPLPYYMTHAEFRYRLVVDPLLAVLSACMLGFLLYRRTEPA